MFDGVRILFIAPRIPSFPLDGGSAMVYHQLRGLMADGHTVIFGAPNTSRHPAQLQDLDGLCTQAVSVDVDTSVTAIGALQAMAGSKEPAPTGLPRAPYTLRRFLSKRLVRGLVQTLQDNPVDVVHADYLPSTWYAMALRRALGSQGLPVLYRAHNVEHRILSHLAADPARPTFERVYRRLLARQTERFEMEVARKVSAVCTLSEPDADWFRDVAPSTPVQSIPPGVELPAHVNRESSIPLRIGMLGSLEWMPNVEGLLWFVHHVLPNILLKVPQATVHIAGKSPVQAVLDLHDGKHVFIHGPVADASEFLATLRVGIVPVLSGSGVRIKILEGLANRLPLVSTSLGAEGLEVRNEEHLLIADEPEPFADACIRMLSDVESAQATADRGRDLVERRYSWRQSKEQLARVYEAIKER
jgi:glycosyltransferase involved in cell wall biosynthesis